MLDLGVILDSKLNFNEHIDSILSSSNKMLGFALRHCKLFKRNKTILAIYYSFVFSKLNFASPIWNPQYKFHVKRLESVQHKLLRFLAFRNNFRILNHDYSEAQLKYNLISLEDRRKMNDMCLLYKILNNNFSVPSILGSIGLRVPERRLRSRELFAVPFRRLNVTQNSPLCRVLTSFNTESFDVDVFNVSFIRFKRCVRHGLATRSFS